MLRLPSQKCDGAIHGESRVFCSAPNENWAQPVGGPNAGRQRASRRRSPLSPASVTFVVGQIMILPSRSMPPPSEPKASFWAWLAITVFIAGYAYLYLRHPAARWIIGGAVLFGAVVSIFAHRRFKRLKEERKEESICTFARALPARDHDTWVVRAVYEELAGMVPVPLRPLDLLDKDLGIDGLDLEDAAREISHRCGRSLIDTKKNPMWDRVKTVADVVLFFENQPRTANQALVPTPTSVTPPAGQETRQP